MHKASQRPRDNASLARRETSNWCVFHHSALETVLDGMTTRPGFLACPSCRSEICFWVEATGERDDDPGDCPVCLSPANGSLLPCGHPLCKECSTNLKFVPIALYESVVIVDALKPEYLEWMRSDPDRCYVSRVNRRRSLCRTGASHRLCLGRRLGDRRAAAFEDLMAVGDGDEFMRHNTLRDSKTQTDYLRRLIGCLERRCKAPLFSCPVEKEA